jgi:trehalose 6-phosphate synthase
VSRLVAVSNRVSVSKPGRSAGGLAVGVLAALQEQGGIWFGWSGKLSQETRDAKLTEQGNITFATIDLTETDLEGYYNGFSNNTLWPLLHYLLGYFSYSRRDYEAYCRVNALFARKLIPLLEPDDVIWVHDYHLIPLAAELRRAGVKQPIGFFLHVPFPDFDVLRSLPPYEHMLRSLAAYDVVGFQTERDLGSFRESLCQPEVGGKALEPTRLSAFGRTFRAGVFPIGVDVDGCRRDATGNLDTPAVRSFLISLSGRELLIGVDRLDYSKGLELRFRAYERMLAKYPSNRGRVVFMQIAPPTRTGVRAYEAIRQALEQAAGNINGRFAEMHWQPIRYLNKGYERGVLMSLLCLSRVALVTPIRDGMNLVAKEYLAAQNPNDPGVLVLSRLAGAAAELEGAVLVNPYDKDGVADGIQQALDMSQEERCERHEVMIQVLRKNDIHAWRGRFVAALNETRADFS